MDTSCNPAATGDQTGTKVEQSKSRALINEIKSLVDTLFDLDDNDTKSRDIIAEHTERIRNVIPPNPAYIRYPKPIHCLLSIQPLRRIEIPLEVLKLLLSSGFNVNVYYNSIGGDINAERMTCLHLAIKNKHYSSVSLLVKHGVDCDKESYDPAHALTEHGITPIAMLARYKDAPLDLFDILKTPQNLNGNSCEKKVLPLHVAAECGHTDIVLHLMKLGASLNKKDRHGDVPLHLAVENEHVELAVSLLEHGSSVNQNDRYGRLPLHLAMLHNNSKLSLSLIKHGSFVNQSDRYGRLPLHIAMLRNNSKLTLSLIEHGSFVNQSDSHGRLPLHLAVMHGNTELAISLIKHGASVNQVDGLKGLPLHLALKHNHTELALSLTNHGASVNHKDGLGHLPIAYYLDKEAHFNGELFAKLIPASTMTILKVMFEILGKQKVTDKGKGKSGAVLSIMLHHLMQHLRLTEPFPVTFEIRKQTLGDFGTSYEVIIIADQPNNEIITHKEMTPKQLYLTSLLFILFDCNVLRPDIDTVTPPHLFNYPASAQRHLLHAKAIDKLWNTYKQKDVRRLQTLCIQEARQSMRSLTSESFQSLPVPFRLRKLLMLYDVADVLCEAFQMWPKYISIENIM